MKSNLNESWLDNLFTMPNQNVLITGASSGIGAASAILFASQGWDVILTYHRDKNAGEKVATECGKFSGKTSLLKLDLRSYQDILECISLIRETYGWLDVLINNAGVLVKKFVADQTEEEVKSQIEINLTGLILLSQASLPILRKQIINVGSDVALSPKSGISPYCASKAAVLHFTKSFAMELAESNHPAKVAILNPTITKTRMHPGLHSGNDPKDIANLIYAMAIDKINVLSGGMVNSWDFSNESLNGDF
jgi:3-oxoacyl-[acyl-carrier protein] reductase